MTIKTPLTALSTVAAATTLAAALFVYQPAYAEGPADAEAAPEVDADAAAAERKRRAKLVCKRERKTGSRVREKVCRTVGQIEDRANRDRTDVDLMTRNARPGNLGE